MGLPVVAIVGRPNVGKSTLFNKLVGERLSIVEDTPGVTRDRIYAKAEWRAKKFLLIDTGGIEPKTDDVMLNQMRRQAELAIETADVIIFMTDLKSGLTASDQDVAEMLMRSRKPVVLCVNKVDSLGGEPPEFYEFYNLAMGDPVAVSSTHGHGTGDLLDEVFRLIPQEAWEDVEEEAIRVAVIGKPNSGKSSLINHILGEDRMIVSDIAGTTRDAVDSYFENVTGKYVLIDTAGIRRKSRVEDSVEKYSVLRSYMACERADVCVLMIDAQDGVTEQDTKIAGVAHENGKACIIVVNKWDLVEKDGRTMDQFKKDISVKLAYMSYAPMLFISAKTGQRVQKLFQLIQSVYEQSCRRVTTGKLNEVLAEAVAKQQPPTDRGRRLKVLYMTQVGVKPPSFAVFVNSADLFHFSYQRYLENQIRSVFGFEGTPIKLLVREREDK